METLFFLLELPVSQKTKYPPDTPKLLPRRIRAGLLCDTVEIFSMNLGAESELPQF
jgi:hypothetical protein